MRARRAANGWCASRTSTCRARSAAPSAAILATLERYGFAWDGAVVRQSARTALYAAALDALCASAATSTRARARGASSKRPPSVAGGERVYPGHLPRRDPADAARRAAARGARARRRRARRVPRPAARARRRRTSRATSAISSSGAPTASSPISSPSSSTMRCRTSRTSCAAPTCSPRRRARSFCSAGSAYPPPSYLHVPVAINAAGEKLSKQTRRRRRCRTIRVPALLAAWRFLEQPIARRIGSAAIRSASSGRGRSRTGIRRDCRRPRCFRRRRDARAHARVKV